jgi:hypothetical protein
MPLRQKRFVTDEIAHYWRNATRKQTLRMKKAIKDRDWGAYRKLMWKVLKVELPVTAGRPFTHHSSIPVDFAKAVWRIMHNKASADDWELIDKYVRKKKQVLEWIESILKDNKMLDNKEELEWWKNEIFKKKKHTLHSVQGRRKMKRKINLSDVVDALEDKGLFKTAENLKAVASELTIAEKADPEILVKLIEFYKKYVRKIFPKGLGDDESADGWHWLNIRKSGLALSKKRIRVHKGLSGAGQVFGG